MKPFKASTDRLHEVKCLSQCLCNTLPLHKGNWGHLRGRVRRAAKQEEEPIVSAHLIPHRCIPCSYCQAWHTAMKREPSPLMLRMSLISMSASPPRNVSVLISIWNYFFTFFTRVIPPTKHTVRQRWLIQVLYTHGNKHGTPVLSIIFQWGQGHYKSLFVLHQHFVTKPFK